LNRDASVELQYTDFVGNRFPTLSTAENYRYWKDTGIDRLLPRVFPIQVPTCRKLHPWFREYITFLHQLDPQRFTLRKIGERYGLKETTVRKVVNDFQRDSFLLQKRLVARLNQRRIPMSEAVLNKKEMVYSQRMGYDHMGDEEVDDDEAKLQEFNGWRSTFDWVQRQAIEVETMTAFPLPEKRVAVKKRVDVDITVRQTRKHKIMNWVDPTDKVIF